MKNHIITLAKKSGKFLLDNFKKDYSLLSMRGFSKEITTKYDKSVDKMIIKDLSKKYPEYNLLTEESGSIDKKSDFTWVVDSLDGSGNFAVGNPFFSVSIALLNKEKPILGVIYAPVLKELFVTEEGKGSLLNGKPIKVSDLTEFKKSYFVSCEGADTSKRISKINATFHPRIKDMRKLGSGAIEAGWIATGRAEAFISTKIDPWDIAAGVLLVEEAGGKVTDFKGNSWKPERVDIIVSNKKLHPQILKIIKNIF